MKTIDLKSFLIGMLLTLLFIFSLGAQASDKDNTQAESNDKRIAPPAFQIAADENNPWVMRSSDGMTWEWASHAHKWLKRGAPK